MALGLLFATLLGYAAWRIVAGGFARPQSEWLNGFGVVGCAVALLAVASFAMHLF